jgi:hypothetical protein
VDVSIVAATELSDRRQTLQDMPSLLEMEALLVPILDWSDVIAMSFRSLQETRLPFLYSFDHRVSSG